MVPKAVIQGILDDLITETTGLLDGASFGLFTNQPDLTNPNLVLADITPADFTTYAAVELAHDDWEAAIDDDGNPYVSAVPQQWQPSNATNLPQIVRGAYLFKDTTLIRAAYFPSPLPVTLALQMVHATPIFTLSGVNTLVQEGHVQ